VSNRGAELRHIGNCSERACDGETGDGGRRLVASEPVEKRGKKPQGAPAGRCPITRRRCRRLSLRGIDANLGPEWGDSFHSSTTPGSNTVGVMRVFL
jgi:hypothetical protein